QGRIRFRGEEISGLPPYVIARKGLGYVPENRDICPSLTVRQNLLLGIKNPRRPGRWSMDDMFALFPVLRERADTPGAVLSGGEQQMLTICRTLMGDPYLIMIDEPTEGLAPMLVRQVAVLLTEIAQRGVAILLVARLDDLLRPLDLGDEGREIHAIADDLLPALSAADLGHDLVERRPGLARQAMRDQQIAPAEPDPSALGPQRLGGHGEGSRDV